MLGAVLPICISTLILGVSCSQPLTDRPTVYGLPPARLLVANPFRLEMASLGRILNGPEYHSALGFSSTVDANFVAL